MREIKFRVWDKKKKIMRYMEDGLNVWICKSGWVAVVNNWADLIGMCNGEIMQFTGLYDRNGKEIYEGDIIEYDEYNRWVVKYDEERAGWFPFAKDDGCGCCAIETVFNTKLIEVIANIYETPELIKEVKND